MEAVLSCSILPYNKDIKNPEDIYSSNIYCLSKIGLTSVHAVNYDQIIIPSVNTSKLWYRYNSICQYHTLKHMEILEFLDW